MNTIQCILNVYYQSLESKQRQWVQEGKAKGLKYDGRQHSSTAYKFFNRTKSGRWGAAVRTRDSAWLIAGAPVKVKESKVTS